MAEDLVKKLVKKRGVQKASLTKFQSYVSWAMNLEEHEITDVLCFQIEARAKKVDDTYNEFIRLHGEIGEYPALLPAEPSQETVLDNFEDAYFEALAQARCIIEKKQQSGLQADRTTTRRTGEGVAGFTRASQIRLPQIELAKFSGGYESWVEFRDTYELLIHHDSTLQNIQKHQYLRASLEGEAALVIKSLEVSADTYEQAWKLLSDRYNNNRSLVHTHLKALFEIPVMNRESSGKIRFIVDTVSKHVGTLKTLKQPTDHWDAILIFLLVTKLDLYTMREWEIKAQAAQADKTDPTLETFLHFLRERALLLEAVEAKRENTRTPKETTQAKSYPPARNVRSFIARHDTEIICVFCNEGHYSSNCSTFTELDVQRRREKVMELRLCFNCLRRGHSAQRCRSSVCKHCNRRHHTLLHDVTPRTLAAPTKSTDARNTNTRNSNANYSNANHSNARNSNANYSNANYLNANKTDTSQREVTALAATSRAILAYGNNLLPTATAMVEGRDKALHPVRVLLDSGAQGSFVSRDLVNRLGLKIQKVSISLTGIGETEADTNAHCQFKLKSNDSRFKTYLSCLVLPTITSPLPHYKFSLNVPPRINLSDPKCNSPGVIDVLIGAEWFMKLLKPEQISLERSQLVLQNTVLGWIVSGSLPSKQRSKKAINVNVATVEIQNQLERFWKLEECSNRSKELSPDERFCEEHFKDTVKRDTHGRFIVQMPLREHPVRLGDSVTHAKRRFYSLERRLTRNPALYRQYTEFIQEYIELGHMTEIRDNSGFTDEAEYYLPHHAVVSQSSETTKLRVVFDASAKTSSGVSLNDIQYVGPVIQDDLWSILLRFRRHNYVVSADITKMYRQVEMDASHRSLQKILWRSDSTQPLQHYRLNTVTYGTAAASFQAIRCLHEVANGIAEEEATIADTIRRDFYVDDLLTGANTRQEATNICVKISSALNGACLPLRKWCSNAPDILIGAKLLETEGTRDFGENEQSKTLGLLWQATSDKLAYKIKIREDGRTPTKRVLLSIISQIFDPLGLLAPVTIKAKIILQKIWMERLDWDDEVPDAILKHWREFYVNIGNIGNLNIPRQAVLPQYERVELHGFSDASESAYGACVYLRTTYRGSVLVRLLTAKSRVAPLQTLTVPRLELCGAHLLSNLIGKVNSALNIEVSATVLWTDSTVVLGWLKASPSTLKSFVSHRVATIQTETRDATWRHVATYDNPSDLLSRGVNPSEITSCHIWWNGPQWLSKHENSWPRSMPESVILPEVKVASHIGAIKRDILIVIGAYSSISKVEKIVAYALRFIHNTRCKTEKQIGNLTLREIGQALDAIIKISQAETFSEEIKALKSKPDVKLNSKIANLCPFLDEGGILRVGGRLEYSRVSYNKKHPAILCDKHVLSKLITERAHLRYLHIGPQGLLGLLRERFWIISGRNICRRVVHDCVVCFRAKPRFVQPKMGNLPEARTSPQLPFTHCGLDYAGPIFLKTSNSRGNKTYKAYIGVFVCMSVKAIHLELITGLTTEAFIAALRRFVSRRGIPQHIYSDNGTNFVGARSELKELFTFMKNESDNLIKYARDEQFSWHFIPARAPNFGGLWEASVKSVKNHLKRVIGERKLTYEDFSTFLTQVEGILNSRPLSALSSDPNDLNPLTPAHFLVGRPIVAVADADLTEITEARLSSFQRIQAMTQHFWRRWSKEYLHQLQTRPKWQRGTSQNAIKEGALVLIAEENKAPTQWKLGRIDQTHKGQDDIIRVVTIRTSSGRIQRPVTKICPLPMD